MFQRCGQRIWLVILCFLILINYFFILKSRVYKRCADLQNRVIWSEELSILERKVCKPEKLERELLEEISAKNSIETSEYNWNFTGVRGLKDLVLEDGGTPHRTLIAASWRTGSTFLGDLFSHLPGSFYYYEPLRYLNTTQVRGRPLSERARNIIKSIFECKSYDVALNFLREKELGYIRHFDRDLRRIWEYTAGDMQLILDPVFMEKVCRLFPFQVVKARVARVDVLKELMEDEKLNLHLVVLTRDPRAVLQSRGHDSFCSKDPECIRPEYFCADMTSDFYAAGELLNEFPERTRVIRFEELASNPYESTKDLLDFLRIDMVSSVIEFLRTHTERNDPDQDTVRVSKEVAYEWTKILDFEKVEEIQIACRGAMELWGYLPAHNQTHLNSSSFNPLGDISGRLRN